MTTRRGALILWLACLAAVPSTGEAQQLELTVSPAIIFFPSADPDLVPQISAGVVTVTIRVRGNGNRPWHLTVLASGNLVSGASTVDISNITWVATPAPPFRAGTMNRTVAQVMASGTGNLNPATNGAVTIRLNNSWTYDTGIYTQTVVFTLSAP
jgi:hypothetical protein